MTGNYTKIKLRFNLWRKFTLPFDKYNILLSCLSYICLINFWWVIRSKLRKLSLLPLVLLLSDFKGYVLVLNHMFNLESAQKQSHHDEITEKQWPINFEVHTLEEWKYCSHKRRCKHLLPKFSFGQLALEPFVLVLFANRQRKVSCVLTDYIFGIICWCQV